MIFKDLCVHLCIYERYGLKLPIRLDVQGKVWLGCFASPREHCYFQVCKVDL